MQEFEGVRRRQEEQEPLEGEEGTEEVEAEQRMRTGKKILCSKRGKRAWLLSFSEKLDLHQSFKNPFQLRI